MSVFQEEIDEWNSILPHVKYLNWSFSVTPGPSFEFISIKVIARVKDSEPPHNDTIVVHHMSIPLHPFSKKTSVEWKIKQLFRMVCHIEVHEASEFFKFSETTPFHAHTKEEQYREFEYPRFQHPDFY